MERTLATAQSDDAEDAEESRIQQIRCCRYQLSAISSPMRSGCAAPLRHDAPPLRLMMMIFAHQGRLRIYYTLPLRYTAITGWTAHKAPLMP